MGTMYFVLSPDEQALDWLSNDWLGCTSMPPVPEDLDKGKLPNLRLVKHALNRLTGYTVEFRRSHVGSSLDARVVAEDGYSEGWSTTAWIKSAHDNNKIPEDDDPVRITFHKGSPELAVLIVQHLTDQCGPLLLVEAEGSPLLLMPQGRISSRVIDRWLNGWPND